jgi:hypothetical protein
MERPPVMSAARGLSALGARVTFAAATCEAETARMFRDLGIETVELLPGRRQPRGMVRKMAYWRSFRRSAWRLAAGRCPDLLWIGSADTALALGPRLLASRYVVQLRELYDTAPLYRYGLKRYARAAQAVVVPEACRAAVYRVWYGLTRTPFVLPNKPEGHPCTRDLQVRDPAAAEALAAVGSGGKMILYQGGVGPARDIRPVAAAVRDLGPPWRLVVMGPDAGGFMHELRAIAPDLVYVPPVVAPAHLEVTSHAHVGVITYSFDQLNHVFCAPNKIWEYAGFGVPMLCEDLPALRFSVDVRAAGRCVDFQDLDAVKSALLEIDADYASFSRSARQLFESVDTRQILSQVLARAA